MVCLNVAARRCQVPASGTSAFDVSLRRRLFVAQSHTAYREFDCRPGMQVAMVAQFRHPCAVSLSDPSRTIEPRHDRLFPSSVQIVGDVATAHRQVKRLARCADSLVHPDEESQAARQRFCGSTAPSADSSMQVRDSQSR